MMCDMVSVTSLWHTHTHRVILTHSTLRMVQVFPGGVRIDGNGSDTHTKSEQQQQQQPITFPESSHQHLLTNYKNHGVSHSCTGDTPTTTTTTQRRADCSVTISTCGDHGPNTWRTRSWGGTRGTAVPLLFTQHYQKQQSHTTRVVVVVFTIRSSGDGTLDPVSTHLSLFHAHTGWRGSTCRCRASLFVFTTYSQRKRSPWQRPAPAGSYWPGSGPSLIASRVESRLVAADASGAGAVTSRRRCVEPTWTWRSEDLLVNDY